MNTVMKRIILLLVITFGCIYTMQAQSEAALSQYYAVLGYYNPASAGRSGELNVTALYGIEMSGWDAKTMFASADMPLKFMKREHEIGRASCRERV